MATQVLLSLLLQLSVKFNAADAVQSVTINAARLSSADHDDINLLTPQGRGTGTVEVFVIQYNSWLPLCFGHSWESSAESQVLCQQLGFNTTNIPATDRAVIPSNQLSLDFNFRCSGDESELTECSYQFLNEHTSCYPITVSCTPCTEGDIQLYNGTSPDEGTVEYCRGGFWRAVCDINWSYQNSFVVCRELELPATAAVPHSSLYHPFPLGIYFNCIGNESSLTNCLATGTLLCNSENIAGVQCSGDREVVKGCADDDVRLIGGRDQNEGRIEVCSNGVWGTIYDGGTWGSHDATVVCRQLGYQFDRAIPYQGGLLGNGSGPILFGYLNCIGNEVSLSECEALRSVPFGTGHSNDAGVRCLNDSHSGCSHGDVRLINGSTMFEGRVEFCYRGMWGSICDNFWDDRDAAVVCQQLHFQSSNATALRNSYFGDGGGPYVVSNTRCAHGEQYSNSDNNLLSCSLVGVHHYTSRCSPGHDAGVICDGCSHGEVRLQNRRVEVCFNGIWARVCQDDIDFSTIATSICKQVFGVEQSYYVQNCSQEDSAVAPVLYDLSCTEQSRFMIHDCTFNLSQSTAECNSLLSIACYPQSNCTEGDVRLVDGRSRLDGRFEICVNGFWGVLPGPYTPSIRYYHHSFSIAEINLAARICRQLGLPNELALPVEILGNYPQLLSCENEHEYCYRPNCNRVGSAFGVMCQGNSSKPEQCQHLDVRLVDGSKETEGRLEICAEGYWSNVCTDPTFGFSESDDYWNVYASVLVCRKLGFPTEVALHNLLGAPFGSSPMLPVVEVDCGTYYYDYYYGTQDEAPNSIDDCLVINQSSLCSIERTIIGISCGEREYYKIAVEVLPIQESYEIGTEVTLKCILPPSLQRLPSVRVHWTTTVPGVLPYYYYYHSFENTSFVIPAHHPAVVSYYCLVEGIGGSEYRVPLARGHTTIKIRDVLKRAISEKHINVWEQDSLYLQVETTNITALSLLSELTWYHNGSVILPDQDGRISFSNNNKTLTIASFSSGDAGIYKAQFNRISVQPYNQSCNEMFTQLLRSYPILAPAVYCVNVNSCADDALALQIQGVTIRRQNTVGGEMLVAELTGSGYEEFEPYLSYQWYINGYYAAPILINSNITYEETGRYEATFNFDINRFIYGGGDTSWTCRAFYRSQLLRPYSKLPLSWGFIDIPYYKNLELFFDTDMKAALKNEGSTLTCQASIGFPPFTMLSLIKNGQAVVMSLNGTIQINSKIVIVNPFGLYICQLNASGEIFEEALLLKEQANIRLMIEMENGQACDFYSTESIEQALSMKISQECRCNFRQGSSGFNHSSIDCEESGKLTYGSTIEYSNDEGSETASVIIDRLANQVPFFLIVKGVPIRVAAVLVDSINCSNTSTNNNIIISPAAASLSGMFIGGFVSGIIIVTVILVIIMTIIIIRMRYHSRSVVNEDGDKGETAKKCTHTVQRVPGLTENDEENIELKEQ